MPPSASSQHDPGVPPTPAASQPPEASRRRSAERRKATRYASGQRGACRPTTGTDGLEVQLKDISVTGVALLAPRRFEKGTLMLLELGGARASGLASVLVRVVRLVAQADGRWLIGCAFVADASEEDILACREELPPSPRRGGSPQPGAASPDRRAWLRLPCYVHTVCRPGVPDSSGSWAVEVRDISTGGLGLIVPGELEQASELRVSLPALDGPPREVQVRVRRRTRLGNDKWLLGCAFCEDPSAEGRAAGNGASMTEREPSAEVRLRPGRGPEGSKSAQVPSRLATRVLTLRRGWEQELAGHPERLAEVEARVRQAFRELAEQVVAELRAQAVGTGPQSPPRP